MSAKDKFLGLLKGIAPTIATAIGGPIGGVAMKFLADKFTGGDTGTVEEFLLSASPADLKELKIAEMEFQREMKSLDIEVERLAAGDRDSARKMATATGIKAQLMLSIVYTVAYAAVLYLFIGGHVAVPENQMTLFGSLLGVLSAAQIQIINFWFGSSAGSKAKTEAMAAMP